MVSWEDYLDYIPEDKREKYDHMGIYVIYIEGKLAYIGKSSNMLQRIANHLYNIDFDKKAHKYKIFRQAREQGYKIQFDVLKYSSNTEMLGKDEGMFIRCQRPPLNYQIPKREDWRKYTINPMAKRVSLADIVNGSLFDF